MNKLLAVILVLMPLGTTAEVIAPAECGGQPRAAEAAHRQMLIEHRYLHLPVRTGAAKKRMKLSVDGRTIREFEIELADKELEFWVFVDLDGFTGKSLRLEVEPPGVDSHALDAIVQADDVPDSKRVYHEANRPQFHFTSRRGWLNDPNGLVWQAGVYHLFYQHNPYGWGWGNMHWGHAESTDLVHWQERPTALYPRQFGDWCFSGSAIVDAHNTGGFQSGSEPPIVVTFTSTGRGECITFSNDRGKTWQEYPGNPVVKHAGRDPKLVWHEPTRSWIMAVYDEADGRQGIAFHHSPDLKHWTFGSKIDGFFECPDLFELPVDGEPGKKVWVLHAADGKYVLGDFDGRAFHITSGKDKKQLWYGNFYAAQSFSNTSDHRRIQIGWANGVTFPGMPFNQQMVLPVELTLRTAADGPRLFAQPVQELSSLRGAKHEWSELTLAPGVNPLGDLKGDLFEISVDFSPGSAQAFELDLRGTSLVYDISKQELTCKEVKAPLKTENGRVRLRVFLDRGSMEVFGNDGRVVMSIGAIPQADRRSIGVSSRGGTIKIDSLVLHELKSAWGSHEAERRQK